MRAIKSNMEDQIFTYDNKILHCPVCGAEYSGNVRDYWYLPNNHVFMCEDCGVEMELVNKVTTIEYEQ